VSQLKLFKGMLLAKPHILGWMQGMDADAAVKPVVVSDKMLVKRGNGAAV